MSDPKPPTRGWLAVALSDGDAYRRLLGLLLPLLFALLVVGTGATVAFLNLYDSNAVDVSVSQQGGIRFRSGGETTAIVYTLHASQMWADTGVVIPPGESACVTASGRVNLAVHRLVDAAVADVPPLSSWIDPSGDVQPGTPTAGRARDARRDQLLILPSAPLGSLLAFLREPTDPAPGPANPRGGGGEEVESLQLVGSGSTLRNNTDQPLELYLTVNDAYLSPSDTARSLYTERVSGVRDRQMQRRWNSILENRYWNLWFDDNVGSFVVQVQPGTDCSEMLTESSR